MDLAGRYLVAWLSPEAVETFLGVLEPSQERDRTTGYGSSTTRIGRMCSVCRVSVRLLVTGAPSWGEGGDNEEVMGGH